MNASASPISQLLKIQTDTATNWSRFFNVTPNYIFNYNAQDTEIEQHVLDSVGSYGSQLSKIIAMVQLLYENAHLKGHNLSPMQQVAVEEFSNLRNTSKSAVREFRGALGPDDTSRIIKFLAEAKEKYPVNYKEIKDVFKGNGGESSQSGRPKGS